MNIKNILLALALISATEAGAVAINRSEARIIAQELVDINDTTSDNVPWAPYYIFSRGAGKGFVIVSGDDSTAPIIGYTECGDYVEEQLPQPLRNMLTAWTEKVNKLQLADTLQTKRKITPARARNLLAVAAYKEAWKDVPTILPTHWHQSYPYNMLAPHRKDNNNQALTGCLATAASQILYYFRSDNPDALLYDTPTYGYGGAPVTVSLPKGTPIRYDLMKTSGTGQLKQDSAVAVLMYAAGTSAWLTYGDGDGTATSGQCSKMGDALRGQFALNCDYKGKWDYTQQGWEKLVYDNLASGRPMLYCGANETQGGHAVVLDGYQASTGLYHFNFGWGGQSDGYYTIDDETGMNGFSSSQNMLANITPKNQNVSAKLIVPALYERTNAEIKAVVSNNATLAQKNFYLYCTNTSTMPSSPSASNETTTVPAGTNTTVSFTYRPLVDQQLNIYLCDADGKVLDKVSTEVLPTKAALNLDALSVDANSEKTTVNGIDFYHLYNKTANLAVTLTNGEGGSVCQPRLRCSLFEYDPAAGTWSTDSTVAIISTLIFNEGQTCDTVFQFRNLKTDSYYKARLVPVAVTSVQSPITINIPDSVAYFRVFEPTLSVVANGRHATVTGDWNQAVFNAAATDAGVTTYDLKAVAGLNSQPSAANPNALFYAANNIDGMTNVVVNDKCEKLVIDADHEFLPLLPFTANKANFKLPDFEPAKWYVTFIPFAASVPQGMQARRINEIKNVSIATDSTTSIPALTPFLCISARPTLSTITADDVTVAADSVIMYDALTPNMSFATVNRTLEQNALLLGEKLGVPYYLINEAGTTVEPFYAVIEKTSSLGGIRIFTDLLADMYYTALADSLVSAYTALADYPDYPGCMQFADSIAAYDLAFSTYSFNEKDEINEAANALGEIIVQFLNGELADDTAVRDRFSDSSSIKTDSDAPVRYYSIDGTPLKAPRPGLVIIRQGNTVRKTIIK